MISSVWIRATMKAIHIEYQRRLKNLMYKELHRKIENRKKVFWPGMEKAIITFPNNDTQLDTITTSQSPEIIDADFLHFKISSKEYQYILVLTDHFAKFFQAYLTRAS